ncbi:MAG TPA: alpha/beta hydrolase [Gammaproteobacteria bacterium]|nr:alpha/beta hydrolase [Gammaproteobacteria bacterium]
MLIEVAGQQVFINSQEPRPDPRRATITFVHGAGMDHTVWTLPKRHFERHGYNVLAVDLPGHGKSSGTLLSSIGTMADWILAVLQALDLQETAIAGHSMGSLVALNFSARHPQHCRALALLAISLPMPVSDELLDAARRNHPDAIAMLNLWGHGKAAHLDRNPNPGMWRLGGGQQLLERAADGVIYHDLQACHHYQEGMEHAARISCPTLLILGQRDVMTPLRNGLAVAEKIPHARKLVLSNCGHSLLSERPNEVLDGLRSVLL